MSIQYKIIAKGRPGTNQEEKNFEAPILIVNETIDPHEFLDKFHRYSSISEADILRCLYSLRSFLCDELKQGNIIQTGVIGTFAPAILKSKKDVSQKALEVKINYRPSAEMKRELKSAELKKIGKSEKNGQPKAG